VVQAGFLMMEVSFYFANVADVADINAPASLPPYLSPSSVTVINTVFSSFDNPNPTYTVHSEFDSNTKFKN
jgi:hypothetical protein